MTTPRVSVVIPTYNSAALVVGAVESVLAQTLPAAEVIVVDDGSTDDTPERLARFGPPVRAVRKPNGGVSAARNRGLAEATGDLIAFLDADDVWYPDKLRRQAEVFARQPDLGLLGTLTVPWPGTFPQELPAGRVAEVRFEDLVVRNHFVTSTVVVRRDVAQVVGEFDGTLSGPEDYDYWLRAVSRAPAANLLVPLTGYRDLGGSLSKQAQRMEDGMRRILGKLERAGVFRGRTGLRRKAWGYFHYSCAYMHRAAGHRKAALQNAVRSLWQYPVPFRRGEVRVPFGRARLVVAAVRQSLLAGGGSC
jgi:glycosyltransferase involved in cell wall biosynthesis